MRWTSSFRATHLHDIIDHHWPDNDASWHQIAVAGNDLLYTYFSAPVVIVADDEPLVSLRIFRDSVL